MRIAHFGTFDIDNYGDLLFPYIIEWRLSDFNVSHFSPVGGDTLFEDSKINNSVYDVRKKDFDALVIGGGNIVNFRRTKLFKYKSKSLLAYSSLILEATKIAIEKSIPLVINAPSVSSLDLGLIEKKIMRIVLCSSSLVSFRDQYSVNAISCLGVNECKIGFVPDTAFDISRMWPNLKASEEKYIVAHVNKRYGGDASQAAKALDSLSDLYKMPIVLLPIGPCHGDMDYLNDVNSYMCCKRYLIKVYGIKKFAKVIASSSLYIGSSMHGLITALSYDIPSYIVLNEGGSMNKFLGLFECAGMPDSAIYDSWEAVIKGSNEPFVIDSYVKKNIFYRLDNHWDKIRHTLCAVHKSKNKKCNGQLIGWQLIVLISQIELLIRKIYNRLL